jgi:uncharacterized membrane-anchored protein
MKPYGIGLIILLAAYLISLYPTYINYNYIMNPPTNQAEYTERYEELKTATLVGFITVFIAILGTLVFLVEFMRHEHEVPASRIASPPP